MLVAYGRIAHTLWFHATPGEVTLTGLDAVGACKRLDERKRVVRMLFVIVSVFAVSWFPFFSLQVNHRESSALYTVVGLLRKTTENGHVLHELIRR